MKNIRQALKYLLIVVMMQNLTACSAALDYAFLWPSSKDDNDKLEPEDYGPTDPYGNNLAADDRPTSPYSIRSIPIIDSRSPSSKEKIRLEREYGFLMKGESYGVDQALIYIDATSSTLSCQPVLEVVLDDGSTTSAPIVPYEKPERFRPEALNSSCIGGNMGTGSGFAILTLTQSTKTITIQEILSSPEEPWESPLVSVPQTQVSVNFQEILKQRIKVKIEKTVESPYELRPLLFDIEVSDVLLRGYSSSMVRHSLVGEIEELVRDPGGRTLSYTIKLPLNPQSLGLLMKDYHLVSARDAD